MDDLFFFDEENTGKVCEGDKVLAHWHNGKFIPATVLKKEYIYSEWDFYVNDISYEDSTKDYLKLSLWVYRNLTSLQYVAKCSWRSLIRRSVIR